MIIGFLYLISSDEFSDSSMFVLLISLSRGGLLGIRGSGSGIQFC